MQRIPTKTDSLTFSFRGTPFGPVVAFWSVDRGEPKVYRIVLPRPETSAKKPVQDLFPVSAASSCSQIDLLLDRMEAFLNGEDVRFSLDAVRLDLCSAFQRKVLLAEFAIPRGRVSTYNLMAKHLKNPKGARAVGTALAANPFPIVIPCHRVIRSDGALGGYHGGHEMKRILLEMEGIAFRDSTHVVAQDFFYK